MSAAVLSPSSALFCAPVRAPPAQARARKAPAAVAAAAFAARRRSEDDAAPLSSSSTPVGLRSRRRRQIRSVAVASSPAATEELPPELKKIVTAFAMVPDPKLKYAQLLAYGKKLDPLPAGAATEENKVRGCVSQVWVVPILDEKTGEVTWLADSDSALTKGLAALLAKGLSGVRPSVVAAMSPDFITELGLAQSLTPSRNNGFLNMFLTMQKLSVGLMSKEAAAVSTSTPSSSPSPSPSPPASETSKPVRASMERKIRASVPVTSLEVFDESSQHAGHAGAKGVSSPSGETHFRLRVVSVAFDGLKTIERHRMVYVALEEELRGPVHALSLETLTPEEAEGRG